MTCRREGGLTGLRSVPTCKLHPVSMTPSLAAALAPALSACRLMTCALSVELGSWSLVTGLLVTGSLGIAVWPLELRRLGL